MLGVGVGGLPRVHLEAGQAFDEGGELGKAIVSGVEVGSLFGQQVSQLSHEGVAVLVRDHLQRVGDQIHHLRRHSPLGFGGGRLRHGGLRRRLRNLGRLLPALPALAGGWLLRPGGGRLFFGNLRLLLELPGRGPCLVSGSPYDLDVDKFVAGSDKRLGGLLLPHAVHLLARLPQADGQAGEVAVAGHQYKAVHLAGVEDVHGVDDHGRVGGVLAGGVAVLLDGGDGVLQQDGFPGGHIGGGPVSVDALDGGGAVDGDLRHHVPHGGPGGVVRVDEHRQAQISVILLWHVILP